MEEFRVSEPKTAGKSPENRERYEEREKKQKRFTEKEQDKQFLSLRKRKLKDPPFTSLSLPLSFFLFSNTLFG